MFLIEFPYYGTISELLHKQKIKGLVHLLSIRETYLKTTRAPVLPEVLKTALRCAALYYSLPKILLAVYFLFPPFISLE
ncbi:hypothetical protein MYVALT_F_03890 [Candidatus Vallotia tarda]|uniref:Uncharacterized protein n=1 Tax=Candidatus Vallotiella hemipterorum TaxID=1177213 RepID=A0A916JV69_9BURK|nr:hypothetical protein MYVALT_F_03890 [Candidatus Vallotia tarda]